MKHFDIFSFIKKLWVIALLLSVSVINAQDIVVSLEAESGVLVAPAKIKKVDGFSGNAYVGDNDSGSSITFTQVNIPKDGTFEFKTYYVSMQKRSIAIKANSFAEIVSTIIKPTSSWDNPPVGTMSTYIYLTKGLNTIKITPHPTGQGGPNMDKFEILTTDIVIPKPGEFPILLEAEAAHLYGSLKVKPINGSIISGLSGGKYIGDFNQVSDSYLEFIDVEVPKEGTYEFRVFSMGSGRRLAIKVNRYEKKIITTKDSPNWDNAPTSMVSTLLYLDKGKNKITMRFYNDNGPNLDKFEIHQTSQTIEKPETEKSCFISDFTDDALITAEHINATLSNLTDNSEYTVYKVPESTSTQVVAKCSQPILLTGYLLSAGTENKEDLTKWIVESSVDGSTWSKVVANSNTKLPGVQLFAINRTYGEAMQKSAQYYRLTAKGATQVEIAEWQLFGVPCVKNSDGKNFPLDITDGLDIQSKATAYPEGNVGEGWSEQFYNLFNRDLSKKYYVAAAKQYYVTVEMDKAYKLTSYTLTSADEFPERDPKRWTLNGYNNELGWVELDRQTEFKFPCRYATMRFDINSTVEFTKFLLDVEDNQGSPDSQLLKWQLFGKEGSSSSLSENLFLKDYFIWSENDKMVISQKENIFKEYKIYNLTGTMIANGKLSGAIDEVSISKGLYVLVLIDNDNNFQTEKVAVR